MSMRTTPEQLAGLGDPRVIEVLVSMYDIEQDRYDQSPEQLAAWDEHKHDPHRWSEFAFPVRAEQGMFLYMLARSSRATRVVEFATSLGFSTIFLAAAVRDNGGGVVISAELVPAKVEQARRNLTACGLDPYVELLEGDARQTLAGLAGGIDLFVLDGWPTGDSPSLALQVLDAVTPSLRDGAMVFDDNGEDDCVTRLDDRSAGFRVMPAPLADGGFLAVYDRPS